MYDNLLAEKKNSLFEDYVDLFRNAVDDAVSINDEQIDGSAIEDYIETLKNIAKDEGLKDIFSKVHYSMIIGLILLNLTHSNN